MTERVTAGYMEVRDKVLRLLKGSLSCSRDHGCERAAAVLMTEVIEPMVWSGAEPRDGSSIPAVAGAWGTAGVGDRMQPERGWTEEQVRSAVATEYQLEHLAPTGVFAERVVLRLQVLVPPAGEVQTVDKAAVDLAVKIGAPGIQTMLKEHEAMKECLRSIATGDGPPSEQPRRARRILQSLGISWARQDDRREEPPAPEPGVWRATTELRWLTKVWPHTVLQKRYVRNGVVAPGAVPVIEEEWQDVPTVTE